MDSWKGVRKLLAHPPAPSAPSSFARRRALTGAGYGLLSGCAYAFVAGTIDVLTARDVPLRAVTVIQSIARLRGAVVTLVFIVLPRVGLSVLATIVLRWIVQRHEHHLEMRGWARWGRQALLVSGVVLLGATPGTWSQMPRSAHQALRDVYALATHTLAQAADAPLPTEFNFAPNLRAHAGVPFVMDQRPAKATAQSVDVRLLFADGYIVTCLVTPEFEQMFCAEGKP
ncbi:MAG TPA: hypothetical protein VI793_00330 [Anaerolineales bacterium]|nr:hypothetical protein [Anaerolineales bacterium]